MKYLVSIEGELYKIIRGEDKLKEYLQNYAQELKSRECQNVDQWLNEMLENGFSNVYTYFPDFVIPFEDWQVETLD